MWEGVEYYAGVAGGEAAYDQTGELEQLVLVKLEYSSGEMEKAQNGAGWRGCWGPTCSGGVLAKYRAVLILLVRWMLWPSPGHDSKCVVK